MSKQYLKMVELNSKFGDVGDSVMQAASWILRGGVTSGVAIDIAAFSGTISSIRVMKEYAKCFTLLVTKGFGVAYEAFNDLCAKLATITESEVEANTFKPVVKSAAKFHEFLGWAGGAAGEVMKTVYKTEGVAQKIKLIEAIHQTMVVRLSCAYLNDEATAATQQNETFADYLDMASSSDPDDQAGAHALGKRVATTLATARKTVDLSTRQTLLEQQDNQRGRYYSADDLSHNDVVAQAIGGVNSQQKSHHAPHSQPGSTAMTEMEARAKKFEADVHTQLDPGF